MVSSMLTDGKLAQLLGLTKWGLGGQPLVPSPDLAFFQLHTLWRADVLPSFDSPWVLAGVHSETFHERASVEVVALDTIALVEPSNSGTLCHKAVLARGNEAVVLALNSDPVAEALNCIELLRAQRVMTLDGIGYRLGFQARSLCGEFTFDNPIAPSLLALEAALIRIAEAAAGVPESAWAEEIVRIWQDYVGKSPGDPGP
jgi:hypothetical protein